METNDGHASRLARMRLCALVDAQRPSASEKKIAIEPSEFGHAVGLVTDSAAWVLVTGRHERSLGPALIWALRNNANALKLFSDEKAGDLARIANYFDFAIEVFAVDDSGASRIAVPQSVENFSTSVADELFCEFINAAGAEVVREHGVICGEVRGLEVCRVVDGRGESQLEIGVGAHDRETFKLLHGQTATIESLRRVVDEVALHRVVGAQVHPLNRLARERMLRHYVCQSPQLVGAKSLQPAQPPFARTNLMDTVPCCATGVSMTGGKMVVIFSVGVDPDVVAFGADARGQLDGSAELVLAMPKRDIVPAIERVAHMLFRPARFVVVDGLGVTT